MSEKADQINPMFLQLVLSLQSAAVYQMGKTVSPISGKIEKDLQQAKVSIDLLLMLQEKTKGNLIDEEQRIIDSTVYNLQMNYVDELNSEKSEAKESTSNEKPSEEATDEKKENPPDTPAGDK